MTDSSLAESAPVAAGVRRTSARDRIHPWRLTLLGGLYVTQGSAHGFFGQSLPTLLRQQGVSLEAIGFSYLVLAPWALNFLWAPLVDRCYWRRLGKRRSWILPLQVILAALIVAVGTQLGSLSLPLLLALATVASLIAATSDVATDGYAVDSIRPAMRGIANGLQIGGYWVGMLIGSGLVLTLAARADVTIGTALVACLILLVAIGVAATREASPSPAHTAVRPRLRAFLARPEARLMFLVIVCIRFGDSFAKSMLQAFLVDAGFDLAQIGTLTGTFGVGAAVVGSIVGGLLIRPLGRRCALLGFGLLQALALFGCWLLAAADGPGMLAVGVVIAANALTSSLAFVALYTAMMDCCDAGQAGTDFTIQACVGNLVGIVAGVAGGQSAAGLGYADHFALATALAFGGLAIAAAAYPRVRSIIAGRSVSAASEASA